MKEVIAQLFSNPDASVYAVLDGASVKMNLPVLLKDLKVQNMCLYRGQLEPDLAARAPYLVKLQRNSELLELWMNEGKNKNWGIFATSYASFKIMRKHFRNLLKVKNSEGKILYFRYYDPRVLKSFLPTCDDKEIDYLHNAVLNYFIESDKENELLSFNKLKLKWSK